MKLVGKFEPSAGMLLPEIDYTNSEFIVNQEYSNLSLDEPFIVVDLYSDGELVAERVLVTTLWDYNKNEDDDVIKLCLIKMKSDNMLDDMVISD
ncbi:hypothetical protein 6939_0059 [Klebsiella phage 6939]|uniref:Uncharacterized protein n=1 Tax=Klebsiella phage 6939 TaxID=2912295 RepID=A0A9E7M7T2_9CAUD|nr:hypothetical protein 6939_0059 [Klebsiella phage 6939]